MYPLHAFAQYQLTPDDIDDDARKLRLVFRSARARFTALCLIRFFKERGRWSSFTESEVKDFCRRRNYLGLSLDELHKQKLLAKSNVGMYELTHAFVARCFMASPKLHSLQALR